MTEARHQGQADGAVASRAWTSVKSSCHHVVVSLIKELHLDFEHSQQFTFRSLFSSTACFGLNWRISYLCAKLSSSIYMCVCMRAFLKV